MKLAMPVWGEKVSPVFDTASKLLVLQLEGRMEQFRFETQLYEKDLARRCSRIKNLDVDVLICGGISRQFYRILTGAGVQVICWISGHVDAVLDAYKEGNLLNSSFLMPGYGQLKEEKADSDGLSLGSSNGKTKEDYFTK